MVRNLPEAHGYSDSKGILPARRAIVQRFEDNGVTGIDVEDVYLGNGVSELIVMTLPPEALLNDGDEVLIPAPDYPLWTASVSLCGGTPVHYLCDEDDGWQPSLDDIESKIGDRTRAIVIINPNNPTGAVYSREVLARIVEVARRRNLIIFADEIYDRILYDDAEHVPIASLAPDLLCLTFGGLSKNYRVAGFRSGWVVLSGPKEHAESYIEGLDILANMRLCPNVPGQHAIQAALGGYQSIDDLVLPTGRLGEQRDRAWKLLNDLPGVSCVKPQGALYVFPRLDPSCTRSRTTCASPSTCSNSRNSSSSRAPASTGRPPTTSASSPSSTPTTWRTPWAASANSSTPTAAESPLGGGVEAAEGAADHVRVGRGPERRQ